MKYIKILIIILLAVKINAQDCKPELSVKTDNPDAFIIINNSITAEGNFNGEVEKGFYRIAVKEDSLSWGAAFTDTIRLNECKTYSLNYTFTEKVYLETEPEDVYLYSKDMLVGHTPLFLLPGDSSYTLVKPGYKSLNIARQDVVSGRKFQLEYTGSKMQGSFFESSLFKILTGSLIVLGGTAAYLKIKADDNYEYYKRTGESKYNDRTRIYDILSGIAFGMVQVNFGILIYHFLIE